MQDGWTSESRARSTWRARRPHATSSRRPSRPASWREGSCFGCNGRNGTADHPRRCSKGPFHRGAGSLEGPRLRSCGSRLDRRRCSRRERPYTRLGVSFRFLLAVTVLFRTGPIVKVQPNHTVVDRLLLLLEQFLEDELAPGAAAGVHHPAPSAVTPPSLAGANPSCSVNSATGAAASSSSLHRKTTRCPPSTIGSAA